jgi:hypothetical protein
VVEGGQQEEGWLAERGGPTAAWYGRTEKRSRPLCRSRLLSSDQTWLARLEKLDSRGQLPGRMFSLLKGRLSLRAHTKTIACKFSCHWASVRCYIIRSSPSPSLRQAIGPARARPNSCSQPGDGSRQRWPFRRSRSRAAAGATQSGRRGSCALRRRPHRTVRGGENRERMGEWLKDGVPTQREWGKLTKPLPFSGWP